MRSSRPPGFDTMTDEENVLDAPCLTAVLYVFLEFNDESCRRICNCLDPQVDHGRLFTRQRIGGRCDELSLAQQ
jgi:hypothetical protein